MESRIWRFVIPRRAAIDITAARGCTYRMNDHNRFAEAKGNGMGQFTGMIHSLEATFARPNISVLKGLVATVLARDYLVGHAVLSPSGDSQQGKAGVIFIVEINLKMNYFSQQIKSYIDLSKWVHGLSTFRLLKSLVEIKVSGFIGINSSRLFCHY
jgi:hypothetical protein